jgi:hypothetical protein
MWVGAIGIDMKEAEANDFDLPGINHESTPISVRLLKKQGENHLHKIPDDEVSFYLSSSWNIDLREWKALVVACEHAGYNAEVTAGGSGIAVW